MLEEFKYRPSESDADFKNIHDLQNGNQQDSPFDPQAQMHKLENSEQVDNFRSELFNQRVNIAKICVLLEQELMNNPESRPEDLIELLNQHAHEARINETQLKTFVERINNYFKTKDSIAKTISEYKARYGEDGFKEFLFKDMFGGEAKSRDLRLDIEDIMISWTVDDPDDFILVKEKRLERTLDEQERSKVSSLFAMPAMVISEPMIPALEAPVGIKLNRGNASFKKLKANVAIPQDIHEKRHATDFAIEPQHHSTKDIDELISQSLNEESNPEDVSRCIERALPIIYEMAGRLQKSEVIATFEPFKILFNEPKGAKKILLSYLAPMMVGIISKLKQNRFYKKVSELIPVYKEAIKSEKAQSELAGKFWQAVLSSPQETNYNYQERIFNSLKSRINTATKKDFSALIAQKLDETYPSFERNLMRSLIAVEYIGENADLSLTEIMWLLENEPIQNWPTLAKSSKKGAKEEYNRLANERILELETGALN